MDAVDIKLKKYDSGIDKRPYFLIKISRTAIDYRKFIYKKKLNNQILLALVKVSAHRIDNRFAKYFILVASISR